MKNLNNISQDLYNLVKSEEKRQQEMISLIASENYVSKAVLEAAGSVLTNKYSEGYPGRRYYPGNFYIDKIEEVCKAKAKEIFGLGDDWQVNVQPYSGAPANLEVYFALLEPGEKILSLKLSHGGHLSHGHKVNASSHFYQIVHYGVNSEGLIDYDEVEKLAIAEKPKIIISGATAYSREIDFKRFGEIAKKVGAYHLADISHIAGLIVAGLHQSPFSCADIVMTTTHKTLRGPRSAVIYSKSEIAEKIDKTVFPGFQGGPHEHIILAKAIAFEEALKPEFKEYQKQIIKNAKVLADELIVKGFKLVSGGTDNHLILMDLRGVIDASEAEKLLEESNILANRNTIPDDPSPFKPSGLRLGTPATTTRGMKESEMKIIAQFITKILKKEGTPLEIKPQVIDLCKKFPIYEN
ncbi:MAG: serine hydroxymethyltransferase [Candidatus Paceibacterota bacterium]|jgi:glycine hydroxymethyltransferase